MGEGFPLQNEYISINDYSVFPDDYGYYHLSSEGLKSLEIVKKYENQIELQNRFSYKIVIRKS